MNPFLRALQAALRGWGRARATEPHLRFHLAAAGAVFLLAFWLELDPLRWSLLVLAVGLVVAAELLNTAVEAAVDAAVRERRPDAGRAKDVAAAGVLVGALAALAVGAFILLPAAPGLPARLAALQAEAPARLWGPAALYAVYLYGVYGPARRG